MAWMVTLSPEIAGQIATMPLMAGDRITCGEKLAQLEAENNLPQDAVLRLAALLWETKALDEALKQLNASFTPEMSGLASDMRGDVLQAKGQSTEAIAAYQQAWKQMPASAEYRRMVQAKLSALGVQVAAETPAETAK